MSAISNRPAGRISGTASPAGQSASVGKFEGRTVTLAGQPPLRLDKIKGNSLPFQGFRKVTKLDRAITGMRTNLAASLKALTRPNGGLNPQALLGGLKTFQRSMGNAVRNMAVSRPQNSDDLDNLALLQMTNSVVDLSSSELAAVYQTFQSREMAFLKDSLQAELARHPENADAKAALANLFFLEAAVIRDVSERVLSVTDLGEGEAAGLRDGHRFGGRSNVPLPDENAPGVYERDISPRNLKTLVETSAQAHTTAERGLSAATEAAMADRAASAPGGGPLSARQAGDVLRGSELTMNVWTEFLFQGDEVRIGSDSDAGNGIWQNMFHLQDRGLAWRGPDYMPLRDAVERQVFPELAGSPTRANERPSYAALNVAGMVDGAASQYGGTVFVLRTETARRATYTVDDTFATIPLRITRERVDAFFRNLDGMEGFPGMPAEILAQLRNRESPIRKSLASVMSGIPEGGITLKKLLETLVERKVLKEFDEITAWVSPLLVRHLGDSEANRARTATYDTLENLLPHLGEVDGAALIHAAAGGNDGRLALSGRFIEAQIQGTFNPARDVGEIRIPVDDLIDNQSNPPRLGRKADSLIEFARANDIKLTFTDFSQAKSDRKKTEVFKELASRGIEVVDFETIHSSHRREEELRTASADFASSHQSLSQTREAARALVQDPGELNARLLSLAAGLPGGAELAEIPLAGAALDRVKARFLENVEKAVVQAGSGSGLNVETTLAEALRTAAERPLAAKIALTKELDSLVFDTPEQKSAFRDWVISARALSDPREMRMIHANALAMAARLERLGPDSSPTEIARGFASGLRNLYQTVDQFKLESRNDDFGPDDLFTEMNRVAFMGSALLARTNPAAAERVLTALESPEIRELRGLCALMHGEVADDLTADDKPFAATFGDFLTYTSEALSRELRPGDQRRSDLTLNKTLNSVSPEARAALTEAAPSTAAAFAAAYPFRAVRETTAFPAAADPGRLPASQTEIRDFHVSMLGVYRGHEETFDGATGVHGMGHASRAFIFATVMANIAGSRGIRVDRAALLCGISAHDSGRRANGRDAYEADSANLGVEAMRARFGPDSLGAEYETAFRQQIDGHAGTTVEALLLQSADSLDIGRTADFDYRHCPFLADTLEAGGKTLFIDPDTREALVREATLLQQLTDPAMRNRARLNELMLEALDASDPEAAQREITAVKDSIRNELARLRQSNNEEYFARIENAIREHARELPLLSRHYFRDRAAAA
ncbi:MAG: DUF3626 domain-containing protein [Planctomycetota bacterium]|jgi:hypothetical protein|nr:DUF3626 domain-containing protein [Planctomycetota bacterium]